MSSCCSVVPPDIRSRPKPIDPSLDSALARHVQYADQEPSCRPTSLPQSTAKADEHLRPPKHRERTRAPHKRLRTVFIPSEYITSQVTCGTHPFGESNRRDSRPAVSHSRSSGEAILQQPKALAGAQPIPNACGTCPPIHPSMPVLLHALGVIEVHASRYARYARRVSMPSP